MKGNTGTYIFIAIALALAGGLLWFFFKRKKPQETVVDEMDGSIKGCVSVPSNFTKWSNEFTGVDWGGYQQAINDYLPEYADKEDDKGRVAGFFKAIDVEPYSDYVRYFQEDIRQWMKSNESLRHWLVTKGYMRCQN